MLEGEGHEEVELFRYQGSRSIVDTRRGTEADVKTRISKARAAFHILIFEKRVEVQDNWQNNENPSLQHKCQVCVAIRSRNLANEQDHTEKDPHFCKSVLVENIFGIVWMDKVSNKDPWDRTNQVRIDIDIFKRRCG